MKLNGKNVIITGATGGFGTCMSEAFLNEGANLLLLGRDISNLENLKKQLDKQRKIDAQWIEISLFDLSEANEVPKDLVKKIAQLECVDVLVNNAAIHGPMGPSWENNFELWKKAFNVNFYGALSLCNQVIPPMIKNKSGSIINISGGGATSSRPNFSSYAISKTALVRYTEILADEVAKYGIRVNAISPGAMATKLLKEVFAVGEIAVGSQEIANAKRIFEEGDTMMNASELCIYLACPDSEGISGKIISAVWDPWRDFTQYKDYIMNSDIYTLRRILPEDREQRWKS
jgi:short-subunit dehydrogenase